MLIFGFIFRFLSAYQNIVVCVKVFDEEKKKKNKQTHTHTQITYFLGFFSLNAAWASQTQFTNQHMLTQIKVMFSVISFCSVVRFPLLLFPKTYMFLHIFVFGYFHSFLLKIWNFRVFLSFSERILYLLFRLVWSRCSSRIFFLSIFLRFALNCPHISNNSCASDSLFFFFSLTNHL